MTGLTASITGLSASITGLTTSDAVGRLVGAVRAGAAEGCAAGAEVIRRHWPVLRALVGVGVLVALVAHLGAGAFLDGLRVIDLWSAVAALGIGLLTTVSSAWRWCLVARGLGLRLSLPVAVADCYQALFLNSVLPAGVLGDVHRAVSHGRRNGNVGRGVRAVVLERMCGQVVLVVVAVGVLLAHPGVLAAVVDLIPGSGGVLALGLAVGLAVAAPSVHRACVRRGRAARNQGARRTGTANTTGSSLGIWPGVVLLSLAATAGYLVLFVVAARAAGSHAALGELVPVLVLGLLAMGLPVNVGGWGPREAVTTVTFGAVGFGTTQGLTAAVVYGVLSLIACLPGLGVLLLRRRARSEQQAESRTPADQLIGATGTGH